MLTMINETTSKLVDEVEAMSIQQLKKLCTYGLVPVHNWNQPTGIEMVQGWTFQKFHFKDLDSSNYLWIVYTKKPFSFALQGDRKPKGITQALKTLWIIDHIFSPVLTLEGEMNWNIPSVELYARRNQIEAAIYSITH